MKIEKLIQNVATLKSKVKQRLDHITTEETTKMSLISPFICSMGYDTEDPREVLAEFTADVVDKKS